MRTMYEQQLAKLEEPVDFSTEVITVPSYMERYPLSYYDFIFKHFKINGYIFCDSGYYPMKLIFKSCQKRAVGDRYKV